MNRLKRWLRPTTVKRGLFYALSEALLVPVCLWAAATMTREAYSVFGYALMSISGLSGLGLFGLFTGFYRMKWSSFGLADAQKVFISTGLASFLMLPVALLTGRSARTVVVWWLLAFVALAGLRALKLVWMQALHRIKSLGKPRCLVVSTGCHQVLASLLMRSDFNFKVVGLVDDDPGNAGALIHGKPVLGRTEQIGDLVRRTRSSFVLVVEELRDPNRVQRVWNRIKNTRARLMVVEQPNPTRPRNMMIKDLIPRTPVQMDMQQLSSAFYGKRVLITGAGGSIGSELARRVASLKPDQLVLFEKDETNLFRIEQELADYPVQVIPFIGDVSVQEQVEEAMFNYWPDMVFHAAAFKHVPMMERYPHRAVVNNIMGTYILAETSQKAGVETFVNISTDKAVRPTSVMGASKRVSEMLLQAMDAHGETRFVSVRFGNVIGSRGSVLELFERALEQGRALRITHPEMKRYFMLTSEAVLLVIRAAVSGRSGIFVLNMGKPVRIGELALRLAEMKGFPEPKMVITGPRPGEKMVEELFWPNEEVEEFADGAVFMVSASPPDLSEMLSRVQELLRMGKQGRLQELRQELLRLAWCAQTEQEVVENADVAVAGGVVQAG